ncbi:hypothetical protein AB4Z29_30355 [Paenibacillus sp. 2TAB23]|uniref:hypothetical protein n=1 Tax=Paenibacillus sp. 2TAB23 TaxID=3233004 RepID=UPI003F964A39
MPGTENGCSGAYVSAKFPESRTLLTKLFLDRLQGSRNRPAKNESQPAKRSSAFLPD